MYSGSWWLQECIVCGIVELGSSRGNLCVYRCVATHLEGFTTYLIVHKSASARLSMHGRAQEGLNAHMGAHVSQNPRHMCAAAHVLI